MATKRTATAPQEPGFPSIADPEAPKNDAELIETEDQALSRVLEEVRDDDDAMVYIYRQGANYRDQTFIDQCPPAEFSLAMLKDEPFNGGAFRIFVRGGGDSGFKANKLIKVQPRPARPTQSAAPAVDPQAITAPLQQQINKLAETMNGMLTMMQAQMQRREPSMKDRLEELELLTRITGGNRQQPAANPMEMFGQVMTMAKTMMEMSGGGPADPMDRLFGLAEKFAPMLNTMAQQQAAAGQQNMPSIEQQPATATLPAPATPEGNEPMMMLKFALNALFSDAATNGDPTPWAMKLVEHFDLNEIEAMLKADNWLDNLAQLDPRARNYPDWLGELREITLEMLTTDESAVKTGSNPVTQDGTAQRSIDASQEGTDVRTAAASPQGKKRNPS